MKNAYYFPHFSNARSDRKVRRLIKDLGIEGYGIYFMLLEVLRDQSDFKYPINDIDLLADDLRTSEAKVKAVIGSYDLFQNDENGNFLSIKLIEFLQPYIEKTERARAAAHKRWDNAKAQAKVCANADANACTNVLPEQCLSNAKKRKERKKKGKENKQSIDQKNPVISQKTKTIEIYRQVQHLKLSKSEFDKLVNDGYKKIDIDDVMDSMENYAKLKNYSSANLTIRSWLKKRVQDGQINQDASKVLSDKEKTAVVTIKQLKEIESGKHPELLKLFIYKRWNFVKICFALETRAALLEKGFNEKLLELMEWYRGQI